METSITHERANRSLAFWSRHKRAALASGGLAVAVGVGLVSAPVKEMKVGAVMHRTLNDTQLVLEVTPRQTLPDFREEGISHASQAVQHTSYLLGFPVHTSVHDVDVSGPVSIELGSCSTHYQVISPAHVRKTEVSGWSVPYSGGKTDRSLTFVDEQNHYVECETLTVGKADYPHVGHVGGHTDNQLVSFTVS
jgi:hypothetical protein